MRERRFLAAPSDISDGRAVIREGEHRHLARVLRLRAGDTVSVFDGRGRGFQGTIAAVESERSIIDLDRKESGAAEPDVHAALLIAILHTERMDWVIEKATELGAVRIVPVLSERCSVRPPRGRWPRLERWRRIALSAAKQSGRLVVPDVCEPQGIGDAIHEPWSEDRDARHRFLLHLEGGGTGWSGQPASGDRVALLVGPEGGWSGQEIDAAKAAGWTVASLGARTLRSETAAVVGLGHVLCARGEP